MNLSTKMKVLFYLISFILLKTNKNIKINTKMKVYYSNFALVNSLYLCKKCEKQERN